MSSVIHGREDPLQIQVQDVNKCFDKLWLQETTNALYEAGLQNDKLNLLFLTNSSTEVAIQILTGITDRATIMKIVMKGTVWAHMFCVVLLDKLGKLVYSNPRLFIMTTKK